MHKILRPFCYCALAFAALWGVGGCATTPEPDIRPAVEAVHQLSPEELAERDDQFRQATAAFKLRYAVLYPRSFHGMDPTPELNEIKALGFDRVLLVINSEAALDEELIRFFRCGAAAGLPLELVLRQRDYFPRRRANRLLSFVLPNYPDLPKAAAMVREFHHRLLEEGLPGLAGFNVVFEPHMFNAVSGRSGGAGELYQWSDGTFGPGLDNDLMVLKSAEIFRQLPFDDVPFTPIVSDDYHDWAMEGKLSFGRVRDLAGLATPRPRLFLLLSGNRPTEMQSRQQEEFADPGECLIPVLRIADHLSVDSGAFRRRNWKDFIRGITFLSDHVAGLDSCGGVVIGPWRVVDYLRNEKD